MKFILRTVLKDFKPFYLWILCVWNNAGFFVRLLTILNWLFAKSFLMIPSMTSDSLHGCADLINSWNGECSAYPTVLHNCFRSISTINILTLNVASKHVIEAQQSRSQKEEARSEVIMK